MKREGVNISEILGAEYRDTITGFSGVVVAVTQWLNGCVRVSIQPKALHDGKPVESSTFDIEQVEEVVKAPQAVRSATGGDRVAPQRAKDPR